MAKRLYRYRRKLKPIPITGGIKFVDSKSNLSYMVYGVPPGTVAYFEHGGAKGRYVRVSVTVPGTSVVKVTVNAVNPDTPVV